MNFAKRFTAFAILLALFTILPAVGCASLKNVKAKIGGTVYIDGRPQAYGTVQAWKDNQMVAQNRCTQSGHYTLADLDPGTYTLRYLNARGAPIGEDTVVEVRLGRFETVDLELSVQGLPQQ